MKRTSGINAAALVLVFLTVPLVCHGTSSSTWHVTVKNTSDVEVIVTVWYSKGTGSLIEVEAHPIYPGVEHKFSVPGAWCPYGLSGIFTKAGKWHQMKESSALGHDVSRSLWTAVCANLTFEVCRKAGTPQDPPRDGDYGFCKK